MKIVGYYEGNIWVFLIYLCFLWLFLLSILMQPSFELKYLLLFPLLISFLPKNAGEYALYDLKNT